MKKNSAVEAIVLQCITAVLATVVVVAIQYFVFKFLVL